MKSTYDIIIWIFIFLLIALIIGLYTSEKKRIPSSLYMRTGGSSTPYIEHFEGGKNSVVDGYRNSSSFDISGGASSKYGWGISDDYERINLEETEHVKKCIQKRDDPICTKDYILEKDKKSCNKCDILQHPNIDKYVLKSSVPSCPKVDLNNYIKKSEIPSCPPAIDLNNYIKKSEVPAIPNIEKCPTCPTIPENIKAKKELQNTYQFNILDVKNLSKEDVQLLLKDERIKTYLDKEYEEKNNVPKPNTDSLSSKSPISSIKVEESSKNNVNYNPSSSLLDEIKGLFGFKKNNNLQHTESIFGTNEEELNNKKQNNNLQHNESIFETNEEELNNIYTPQNNIIKNVGLVSSNQSNQSNQTNRSNKNILQHNESIFGTSEEENKMIYNKNCDNNNFLKPMESNASGLYAGDSLYASV